MPLIQVKLIEDVFTPDQKREIITKLTDAIVSVEGENLRPATVVLIEEIRSGDWGFGGKPMTTEAVHALAAGKTPAVAGKN
ncbi:MAG TPA: 4-oxalocrotonate tautomerase family protein [Terriglobales bacterium]|jgi:4-oxalocrotonate tautomerase|nr:4-oxalocrotonate tautomerase family protein [Terriglobales bacterium]